ncbi:MAG TPA: helix-turn-helix domain-containing protein [Blastocatellia bacterium]|nr:helix-turn-helix domain-containing protein [Blastocatellia bacterium]
MIKGKSNKQPKVESLGEYLKRIMSEKRLTMIDVQERSDKKITDAYIANLVKGIASNPSVDKLKALAVGLGEPEEDVFKIARGVPLDGTEEQTGEPWSAGGIVKAMELIIASPERTQILRAMMQMPIRDLKAVLQFIESMKS